MRDLGQGDPLLLSSRKTGGRALRQGVEAHHAEKAHDLLADLLLRHLSEPEAVGHVVEDVHVGEEAVALEDHGGIPPVGGEVGDVLAPDEDPAPGGQLEPGDHAQRGGLAAPRGPEKGDQLTGGDDEIRLFHGGDVLSGLGVLEHFPHVFKGD